MNPPTNNWSQRRFMWNRRGHQNVIGQHKKLKILFSLHYTKLMLTMLKSQTILLLPWKPIGYNIYRKMKKTIEDSKEIIRSRKSKDRQYSGQKTISNSNHAAQQTIYWATRIIWKRDEIICPSRRVSSSFPKYWT